MPSPLRDLCLVVYPPCAAAAATTAATASACPSHPSPPNPVHTAFQPYYLGWNATALVPPANGSACIHHAFGDAKKISITYRPVTTAKYLGEQPTHFVVSWSQGLTEEGSSGEEGC